MAEIAAGAGAGAGATVGATAAPRGYADDRFEPMSKQEEADALTFFRVPSIINDQILLGSTAHAQNTPKLLELGTTHVLNVHTRHRFRTTPFETEHIPISDYGDDDLSSILDKCFAFMDKSVADGAKGRVLVHCSKGVNRSVTVVIAYLVNRYKWTLKRAYTHVTDVRHIASPHERYFEQLQRFECEWHGLDKPTLTREDVGPSLQQQLRDIAAGNYYAADGAAGGSGGSADLGATEMAPAVAAVASATSGASAAPVVGEDATGAGGGVAGSASLAAALAHGFTVPSGASTASGDTVPFDASALDAVEGNASVTSSGDGSSSTVRTG